MARAYLTEKSNQLQFMNAKFGDKSDLMQGLILVFGFVLYLVLDMYAFPRNCTDFVTPRLKGIVYVAGFAFLAIGAWKIKMHFYPEKSD